MLFPLFLVYMGIMSLFQQLLTMEGYPGPEPTVRHIININVRKVSRE